MNQIMELVRFASLAPSSHNTQPWLFEIGDDLIRIFPDFSRRLPIADPDNRELYISLGCAVENFVISAESVGYGSEIEYFPDDCKLECVSIKLIKLNKSAKSELFKAIPLRHTNRLEYYKQQIPSVDLKSLQSIQLQKGVSVSFLDDTSIIKNIIELIGEANKKQMNDGKYMRELLSWIRFSDDEAAEHLDGLASRAMGIAPVPGWIGRFYMKVAAGPKSQTKEDSKKIMSSSALMTLSSDKDDKAAWLDTGRSFERIALSLTLFNIKNAHHNQPIQVKAFRNEFGRTVGVDKQFPQLMVRLGYAEDLPHSPRRPVNSIIKKL